MLVGSAPDCSLEGLIRQMQAGSVVVSQVSTVTATWSCLVLLLSTHLAMNRAAVRAVSMHSLNRQRANIVFSTFLDRDEILTPEEVSDQERIFEWDGVLRWRCSAPIANAKIGIPLQSLTSSWEPAHASTGSIRDTDLLLMKVVKAFSQEEYLLWYDVSNKVALIVLKDGASSRSQLKAWALGLWVAHRFNQQDATSAPADKSFDLLESTLVDLSNRWKKCIERLEAAGWDVDVANLETTSGSRIRVHPNSIYQN